MNKMITRDCGIPEFRLLKNRIPAGEDKTMLVTSPEKMALLRKDILQMIPRSGMILIYRVTKAGGGGSGVVFNPFKVIRGDWELGKKVAATSVEGINLFEHMLLRLEKGEEVRFIFRYAVPDAAVQVPAGVPDQV